ncbi:hypothetical protein HNY73_015375 [Argiope bruennichi]|uniref:Uncharacterized protein n=1 Tax=Argiope bruennichi TaxID=94029 RepID=A0A8T0EWK6_ARGBR|nr:hypothetical protein HNY73_015375 [Argiope bruennichi]
MNLQYQFESNTKRNPFGVVWKEVNFISSTEVYVVFEQESQERSLVTEGSEESQGNSTRTEHWSVTGICGWWNVVPERELIENRAAV